MRSKGYSQLARALTERLGRPVSRQLVRQWAGNRSVNLRGETFPGTDDVTAAERWVRGEVRKGRPPLE